MQDEHINALGERTNCAFHRLTKCAALVEWYNLATENEHCLNCPFFKTTAQYEYEKEKYPYIRHNI